MTFRELGLRVSLEVHEAQRFGIVGARPARKSSSQPDTVRSIGS
jgi:hypothetical protein